MGAALDHPPRVQDHGAVGVADRFQTVSDDQRASRRRQRGRRLLARASGRRVQARRRLVEEDDRRVDQAGPREGHELALADREVAAALADWRVQPARQRLEHLEYTDPASGSEIRRVAIGVCERDVLANRAREDGSWGRSRSDGAATPR